MRDTWAFAPSHLSLDCESHCCCCMVSAGCRRRKGRRLGWSCRRPLCWREISATRQDPVKGGLRSARARVVTIEAVSMEARESPGDVTRSLANYLPLDRMRACFRYRGGGLTCHVLTRSGVRGGQVRGEKRIVRRNSTNDDHVCFVCPPPCFMCFTPHFDDMYLLLASPFGVSFALSWACFSCRLLSDSSDKRHMRCLGGTYVRGLLDGWVGG